MAGLKKPNQCPCGSVNLHREYGPERWVCDDCNGIARSRQRKPDKNSCRECSAERGTKPFKEGKNLCMDCHRGYMQNWTDENRESIRERHNSPEYKAKRRISVKKAIQRTPEAFIRYLFGNLVKPSRATKKRSNKNISPQRLAILNDIQINVEYVIDLWVRQDGLCAITGLGMVHRIGDLRTISVDRIDSESGYVPGNVQLVCKWANLAKGRHDDKEFRQVLSDFVRISGD